MSGVLLALAAVANTAQNILKKQFSLRCPSGVYLFNAIMSLAALAFFAVSATWHTVSPALIGYSAAFALSFLVASGFTVLAIQCGSLAKTVLILSYSLLIPTIVGILFWSEPLTITGILGFMLLLASLFLTNYKKSDAAASFSWKWVLFVSLAFFGNGMCSVIQRMGQKHDSNGSMLMVMALAMVTVVFFLLGLIKEKGPVADVTVKKGWHLAVICGLLNGLTNYLVMLLNGLLPASVLFPVIAAGGLVITFIVSVSVYKETFTRKQIIGFVAGIGAILLLNI